MVRLHEAGHNDARTIRPRMPSKPIFEYMDYRAFMRDACLARKEANPKFSQRWVCLKLGLKSPGHLSQILTGRANISLDLAERIIEFLGLKQKEAEYFRRLVLFCQAKTHDEKRTGFGKLLRLKQPSLRVVQADQYEFYDKWYYTAVREALSLHSFRGDFRALAKAVMPAITAQEAESAIALLMRLGLIARQRGVYVLTGTAITTGYDVQSLALNNFVVNSLALARNALDTVPSRDRNLSWTTFAVSQAAFRQIEDELRAFRRRIQEVAAADARPERAYQINFQLFPISPPPGEGAGGAAP